MRVLRLACAAVAVTACGGGGDGGGTQPPPQIASVAITSPSGAQTIAACGTVNFTAQALNAAGGVVSGATINWTSSDPSKVALSSATGASTTGSGVGIGSSTVRATANNGAVTSNGVGVTVTGGGAGANAEVAATASNTFSPSCVTISAGGSVAWTFVATPSHNVKFTSARPTGGDIQTTQSTTVSRTFQAAGSYPYHCDLHPGMTGTVVVQ